MLLCGWNLTDDCATSLSVSCQFVCLNYLDFVWRHVLLTLCSVAVVYVVYCASESVRHACFLRRPDGPADQRLSWNAGQTPAKRVDARADPELVSRGWRSPCRAHLPSPLLTTSPRSSPPSLLPSLSLPVPPLPSYPSPPSFPSLSPPSPPCLPLPSPPLEEGGPGVLPRKILKF